MVGSKELRYSLKTGSFREARLKFKHVTNQVKALFRTLKENPVTEMDLDKAKIKALISGYVRNEVED